MIAHMFITYSYIKLGVTIIWKIYPNVNLTTAFSKTELSLINQSNISEKVKEHGKNHFNEKKNWHPIFKLIYQWKANIDRLPLVESSLSKKAVTKISHFDLATLININLYCFKF